MFILVDKLLIVVKAGRLLGD